MVDLATTTAVARTMPAARPITIRFEIARYRPEKNDRPYLESFEVPFHADWVVLDALNYLKDEVDGTLSYRWSCRMGVCGSCGMMVNGVPSLTCSAFLRDYLPGPIRIEPLANFPVERDLDHRAGRFHGEAADGQAVDHPR